MGSQPKWIGHVNLNVRDRPAAEAFYGTVLGMQPLLRMEQSPRQSGQPFAISGKVWWDGVLLGDGRGLRGSALDTLQWHPPLERDDPELHRMGLDELLFGMPDLLSVRDSARGLDCPVEDVEHRFADGRTETVLHLQDPDGTHIEVDGDSDTPRFRGVRINCASLEASADFYSRVCGLTPLPRVTYRVGERSYERQTMRYEGKHDTFRIELSQVAPDDTLAPTLAVGNGIGLYRIAFMVADIAESVEWLKTECGIEASRAEIEIGGGTPTVHAAFFKDPDGTTVQYIEYGFLKQ